MSVNRKEAIAKLFIVSQIHNSREFIVFTSYFDFSLSFLFHESRFSCLRFFRGSQRDQTAQPLIRLQLQKSYGS